MPKPLDGMKICFTGTLSRSRDEWTKIVNENGGLVKGTVIRDLTYLVVTSEEGWNTGKTRKARQYGIECISEEQLLEMIGGEPTREKPSYGDRMSALEID